MTAGRYATEHASALADVRAAGQAVTFTWTTPGAYNPSTDTTTGATTVTLPGAALRTKGNPLRYQALSLVQSEAPSLLFAPDVYGSLPPLNASGTFGGVVYRVRDVEPIAPDGVAIMARLVVVR